MCTPVNCPAWCLLLSLLIGTIAFAFSPPPSQSGAAPATPQAEDYIRVEMNGLLEVATTGADQAGLRVRAGGVTWELDPSTEAALLQSARHLVGKRVVVTGTLVERRADGRLRRFVTATTLVAGGDRPRDDSIAATMRGTLRSGVMAIGGETTGVTLTANGTTWDLQLGPAQRADAERLSGGNVVVSGELRSAPGVEVKDRIILNVRSLSEGGRE